MKRGAESEGSMKQGQYSVYDENNYPPQGNQAWNQNLGETSPLGPLMCDEQSPS